MSGSIEFGACEVCGEEAELQRKYYRYNIKCECHGPQHFELVRHCKNCEPKEPVETKVTFRTELIEKIKG